MAFSLAGIKYRDELFSVTKDGDRWTSAWGSKYKELEVSGAVIFPNLPYLTLPDGKTTLVQSKAILRYVGRVGNIYGDSDFARARIDEVIDLVTDLRSEMSPVCYGDFEAQKTVFATKSIPYFFSGFTKMLESNKTQFITSDKPTIADCELADVVLTCAKLSDDVTGKSFAAEFPELAAYAKRVFELPELAGYVASPASGMAANNKMAKWGNAPRNWLIA
jgi:glutathione S-transferase